MGEGVSVGIGVGVRVGDKARVGVGGGGVDDGGEDVGGVGAPADGVMETVGEILGVITASVGVAPGRKTATAMRERGAKNI